jgi:SAM-dependent methyltransferase
MVAMSNSANPAEFETIRMSPPGSRHPFRRIFPESQVVSFIHREVPFVFFSMLNELVLPHHVVLDFGAGRGRLSEAKGRHLRSMVTFKGRVASVIGVDVDDAVLGNPLLDEAYVIKSDGRIPLPDNSVDVIFSVSVFEHLGDPKIIADEFTRVLKPGGWVCAATPNKWGYIAFGSRLVPNALHAKALSFIEPRTAQDVFPTHYRLNSLRDVRRYFPDSEFENYSFEFNGQPSYNFGRALIARLWLLYMALTPRMFAQSLMIFVRKKGSPR